MEGEKKLKVEKSNDLKQDEVDNEGFVWRKENGDCTKINDDDFVWGDKIGENLERMTMWSKDENGETVLSPFKDYYPIKKVYRCTFKKTGEIVVISKYYGEVIDQLNLTKSFINMKKMLLEIDHPFIIKLLSYFEKETDDGKICYFVMENCSNGTIEDFRVKRGGKIPPKIARYYIAEIIMGLRYLKKNRIVHRNLRTSSFLLDSQGHIRISNFIGMKIKNQDHREYNEFLRNRTVPNGELENCISQLSPEMLNEHRCSAMTDIWAVGITLYHLLTGKFPFKSPSPFKLCQEIKKRNIIWDEVIDSDTKDFIDRILRLNPKKRIGYGKGGYKRLMNHTFFGEDFRWKRIMKKRTMNLRVKWEC